MKLNLWSGACATALWMVTLGTASAEAVHPGDETEALSDIASTQVSLAKDTVTPNAGSQELSSTTELSTSVARLASPSTSGQTARITDLTSPQSTLANSGSVELAQVASTQVEAAQAVVAVGSGNTQGAIAPRLPITAPILPVEQQQERVVEAVTPPPPAAPRQVAVASYDGSASWYGPGFHGNRSASGEIFNQNALTAAHRSLPFGTQVRVTNLNNGRSVIVRINDRGPFSGGRIIDLSRAAASAIDMVNAGVARVRVEVLETVQ